MKPTGRKIRLPCYGITMTLVRGNGADEPGSGAIASDLHAAGRTQRIGNTTRSSTASNR